MAHTSNERLGFAATVAALTLAGAAMLSRPASAQTIPADTFAVNYYTLAHVGGAPDGLMRIVNPTSAPPCAMVYVFNQAQVLNECCGCPVSHNGLVTLSVNNRLTANPAKARVLINGVIKVVSAIPNGAAAPTCDPTTAYQPTAALREWITHPQVNTLTSPVPSFSITEEEFADSPLLIDEADLLVTQCKAIKNATAKAGSCTCPQGG